MTIKVYLMFSFDFPWQILDFLTSYWKVVQIILLLILGLVYYLAFKKPIWANFLVIILLPSYLFRSKIFFLPFTYLEVCILIVFLALIVRLIADKPRTKEKIVSHYQYPYKWPIVLILLAATISVFVAPDLLAAAGLWKAYFVEAIMFFIVLINTVKTDKDRNIILWALGLSTLTISLLAIYQKFTAFGIAEAAWVAKDVRRVNAMFTSPNAVGLYLGPIMAIYFGWLLNDIKQGFYFTRQTLGKLLILILGSMAVIYTVSQGTWLGLVAALIFISFFGWSKKWTTTMVAILIILTILIPQVRNQIIPLITFQDISGQNRLTLWQGSFEYLTNSAGNFIFGAGIFGFPQIQENFRDPLKMEPLIYPHNIILNFWLELGLLGLIGFIWLIISFFKKGLEKLTVNDQLLIVGIMAAMVTIIVHGLIDVPYFKNDLAVLFWVIISLSIL